MGVAIVITLMRGGNIGMTATTLHPDGHSYVLLKRDIPGSCILLYEQDWNGNPTRLIKMWPNRTNAKELQSTITKEEQAAHRPTSFAVEAVEKPISTPSLVCRPDGSVLLNHTFGGSDGLCDWQVEILPNVCAPFTPTGTWPLTVSATDDQARRVAQGAQQQAAAALAKANEADDTAEEALKKAGKGGLTGDQVLQIVSDDIANNQGRLRHALWPRILTMVADAIYVQLKDAASPLINTIRNGGQVVK